MKKKREKEEEKKKKEREIEKKKKKVRKEIHYVLLLNDLTGMIRLCRRSKCPDPSVADTTS